MALAQREHRAGRLVEAAAAYHRILALRPDIAEVYNDLGIILAQQGKLDLALARFEQAVALRPDYAEAHYNLGNILMQQGKLDLQRRWHGYPSQNLASALASARSGGTVRAIGRTTTWAFVR